MAAPKAAKPEPKAASGTATSANRRPRRDVDITSRITARDARMLRLIAEHRVLTSRQITTALFTDPSAARHRIRILRGAGLIETFRPPVTRHPPLYCVATAKAVKLLGYGGDAAYTPPAGAHQAAAAAALRPDLEHLRGVNDFFCRLIAHARSHPDAALEEWRSEWATARLFPARVRPDGFGRWRDGEAWCEFLLEYDTGTEPLARLAAKIPGYADLMHTADTCSPVLFWLRTPGREQHLHALLADTDVDVPIATATGDPETGDIAGTVWKLTFATGRLSLAALGQAACDHLGVPHRPHVL
jgi:hypothetical protein